MKMPDTKFTALRKTEERVRAYQELRKVYPVLPPEVCTKSFDQMMIILQVMASK